MTRPSCGLSLVGVAYAEHYVQCASAVELLNKLVWPLFACWWVATIGSNMFLLGATERPTEHVGLGCTGVTPFLARQQQIVGPTKTLSDTQWQEVLPPHLAQLLQAAPNSGDNQP